MNGVALLAVLIVIGMGPVACGQQGINSAYDGLRKLALESSRTKLGLPATAKPDEPWGAVMEWGLTRGTATVVSYSDGHASVYLSNGGGFLGGAEAKESIRAAAKKMVAAAVECRPMAQRTDVYPLPKRGEVRFYFLTDAGIFTAATTEGALSGHRDALAKLGDAAQEVITQYRRAQR